MAITQDGNRIVTGSSDQTAKIWDASTGIEIKTLFGHTSKITCVSISQDGSLIVTGSSDQTIKIWDSNTGKELKTLTGHNAEITSIAISFDGKFIVSGSLDKTAKLWDLNSNTVINSFPVDTWEKIIVGLNKDASKIVTSYDSGFKIWDAKTGSQLNLITGHNNKITSLIFSNDYSKLVTGSADWTAKIWDLVTYNEIRTYAGFTNAVLSVAISQDGSKIVTGSGDWKAKLWDENKGEIRTYSGHSNSVTSVAISYDGNKIVTGSNDWRAMLWDLSSGKQIQLFSGHTDKVTSVAISLDGNKIVTGSSDKTARIWDANTGKQIQVFSGHNNQVNTVAISQDGSIIVTGSSDKTARIWDANTGKQIQVFSGHIDQVNTVAISQDGSKIVTGSSDKTVRIWDVNTGNEIQQFKSLNQGIEGIVLSPDESKILAGIADSTIIIWDIKTGKEIVQLIGHNQKVSSIAINNDGSKLLSGSSDLTAKLWYIGSQFSIQEDQSDSVFSIIAPELDFKIIDVNMGKELLNQYKDTAVASLICNKGKGRLHVLGLDLTSGDVDDFTIPRGAGDFFLEPGECKDIMFSFEPHALGYRSARATLRTTIGDFKDTILIHGIGIAPKLIINTAIIDFDPVRVLRQKDSIVKAVLKNIGTADITITGINFKGPNLTDFKLTSEAKDTSFTIPANGSANMNLSFKPSDEGRTSGVLAFNFNDIGSPAEVQLFGNGIDTTSYANLELRENSSYSGQYINIPIYLNYQLNLKYNGITGFKSDLTFNPSILFPMDYPLNKVNGSLGYITINNIPSTSGKDSILTNIKFYVGLGSAEECHLSLTNFSALNGKVEIDTIGGTFKLLGVCKDGGDRLLNTDTKKFKLSIMPNPVGNSISVNFEAIEKGLTKLYITDITGNTIETLMNQEISKIGLQSLECTTANIPSGEYFITVQSPTMTQTEKIKIVK